MRLLACLIVAPQRGYDEPAILSYAISSFCPTSADGLQATPLQHDQAPRLNRIQATSTRGVRARIRRVAGCATPTGSAGHAGATANLKLTFHLDHSAGADHCPHRVALDAFGDPALRDAPNPFVRLLWERGTLYEREVIGKLNQPFFDLSGQEVEEREQQTLQAIARGACAAASAAGGWGPAQCLARRWIFISLGWVPKRPERSRLRRAPECRNRVSLGAGPFRSTAGACRRSRS